MSEAPFNRISSSLWFFANIIASIQGNSCSDVSTSKVIKHLKLCKKLQEAYSKLDLDRVGPVIKNSVSVGVKTPEKVNSTRSRYNLELNDITNDDIPTHIEFID